MRIHGMGFVVFSLDHSRQFQIGRNAQIGDHLRAYRCHSGVHWQVSQRSRSLPTYSKLRSWSVSAENPTERKWVARNEQTDSSHILVDGLAFEDVAIDYDTGIAYLPGDYRILWNPFDPSVGESSRQGAVYQFDIASEKFKELALIRYPHKDFHPLGVGLLKSTANHVSLPVDDHASPLSSISSYSWLTIGKRKESWLLAWKSFVSIQAIAIN